MKLTHQFDKNCKSLLILVMSLCMFFVGSQNTFASKVYSDNFDSYTTGEVLVGNGWYGSGNIKVDTGFFVSSPNGVYDPSSSFSELETPNFGGISKGHVSFSFQFLSGQCNGYDNLKMSLDFDYNPVSSNGIGFWCSDIQTKFKIKDYTQTTTLFDHLDFNTTYNLVLDFDTNTPHYRLSVDNGATFSPWVDMSLAYWNGYPASPAAVSTISITRNNFTTPLTFDDFNVYNTAFATIPAEYFAKISNAPSGIAEMRGELDQNGNRELIKTFPNDWILKVFFDTLTPDGWIKVQDMTDESFGWMQGGMERLPYDETKQEEFESVSSVLLTTKAERAAEVVDIVRHYYDNTNIEGLYDNDSILTPSLYNGDEDIKLVLINGAYREVSYSTLDDLGFPIELLLAIIAQETGDSNFDNENVSFDYGHGLMQVTMDARKHEDPASDEFGFINNGDDPRGRYSDVKLSKCKELNSDEYKKCYENTDTFNKKLKPYAHYDYIITNPKYKQYANTLQSMYANVKDGLGVLAHNKYGHIYPYLQVKPKKIPKLCTEPVIMGTLTFTCDELQVIKAVWGYNGASVTADNYLGLISKKLNKLTSYYDVDTYANQGKLIEKLSYAGAHRIELRKHSPIDITIKDSQGNVVGVENGEIKADIDNSDYDPTSERAVVFFPNGTYTYQVVGDSTGGTYGIDINIFNGSETPLTFNAVDLPITPGEVHTYQVDEAKLANNAPDAVTVSIDKEGDGIVDEVVHAGNSLTDITDTTPTELKVTFNTTTKDVEFSGVDTQDLNPTVTINGQNITIEDNNNNITIIPFTKYKDLPTRLRLSYNKIVRNGVTITVPNTNIVYDWKEKNGVLTDLDTRVMVKGVERYMFNYKKVTNKTTIKEKTQNGMNTTTKQGFVLVTVITNQSSLDVSY